MFDNTTTFNSPNLDMIQGYTPTGASTSCPGALGTNWTCAWSSDTFAAGQTMAAGTTTVHLYPENNVSTTAFRAASEAKYDGIQYRGVGTFGAAASGNVTPGLPTGWQPDDIHICIIETRDNVATTMPAGWTQLNAANSDTTHRATLFWRRAVSGDGNPLVTHSGGDSISARIIGFSGVDTTTAFDVTNSFTVSGADLTTEAAAITTATEQAMLIFTAHMANSHTSIGLPTPAPSGGSWTQVFFSATGGGSDSSISAHYGIALSAAGNGAFSATRSGANAAISHGALLALRPLNKLTISTPSTTVAGDVRIASISFGRATPGSRRRRAGTSCGVPTTAPTYYKVAVAGDIGASHTWGFSATHSATGGIQSFSGVDTTSTPYVVENGQTTVSGTSHRPP